MIYKNVQVLRFTFDSCPYVHQICALHHECFPEVGTPDPDCQTVYVALKGSVFCGHAMLYHDGEIANVCVIKTARREGIATQLLTEIVSDNSLHLWVAESNSIALHLYQKTGFRLTQARRSNEVQMLAAPHTL